jgi:hypothetical protein
MRCVLANVVAAVMVSRRGLRRPLRVLAGVTSRVRLRLAR